MDSVEKCIRRLSALVGFPSVSSTSNVAVSQWARDELTSLGFEVEQVNYTDAAGIDKVNLVACRRPRASGGEQPGLAYFCHTDVVPADQWNGPGGNPFRAHEADEKVFGRGSCDMKGSLATMLSAAETVPIESQRAPLWIVCTADEEVGFQGATEVVENSAGYRDIVQAQPVAIIGEPTSLGVVHAHKGIAGLSFTSEGRAAHSSTTLGINANEALVPLLQLLLRQCEKTREDSQYQHDAFDPPTLSWNFGVSDRMTTVNVTPGRSTAWLSYRPMPGIDADDLISELVDLANRQGLQIEAFSGCGPVWTDPGAACVKTFCELAGVQPTTACYGTDGGVFSELEQRIVCGPGSIEQAHTTDEWIEIDQLRKGIDLYRKAIKHWCVNGLGSVLGLWILCVGVMASLLGSPALGADRTTCCLPLAVDAEPTTWDSRAVTAPERFGVDSQSWTNYLRVWKTHSADPSDPAIRKFLALPLSTSGDSVTAIRVSRGRAAPNWIGWRPGSYQQVDTPHFTIYSRAPGNQAREIAEDLERCYWVWTQMFFPLWEAGGQVGAALAAMSSDEDPGEYLRKSPKRISTRRKMRVVLFRDAAEYQNTLGQDVPGIERSTGFYNDARQTVFLYGGQDNDPATRRHEVVHQLFREATRSRLGGDMPGEHTGFWLVEGIAGYFESLHFGEAVATVGGWDSPRLQFARYRILAQRDVLPLTELHRDGRLSAQRRGDLARWYAHSIAQTHHLLDGPEPSHRRWVYQRLAELYAVQWSLPSESLGNDPESGLQRFLKVDDKVLLDNPPARTLRKLCLAGCEVTSTGLASLPVSEQLEWLDLSRMPVDSNDVLRLCPDASELTQLSLEATRVDDGLTEWIKRAEKLTELDLSFTKVTDTLVDSLPARSGLAVLWLTGSKITDRSVARLKSFNSLESLDVQRTGISEAAINQIREAMPDLQLNPLELR